MRCRTLSAAAEVLHVSQPALSKAVRHCEDRLGYPLFLRRAGRLVPTAQAEELLPEVERLFREMQGLKALARELGGGGGGVLRIGATSSLAVSAVPKAIAALRREHPAARIVFHLLPVSELAEALVARRIDLGVALSPIGLPGLETSEIGTTSCVVLIRTQHPLARRKQLGPKHLAGEPEIGFGSWLDFGRSLDAAFEQAGIERRVAIEVGTTLSAMALVREGAGVAVVDGLSARDLPPGVVARPFVPALRRRILLVRAVGLGTSKLASSFIAALRAALPGS